MWLYNDKEFTSDMIQECVGFVYEIENLQTHKKYIGKKRFWSKVTRPPLKGRKNKRRSVKESNWQEYYGSNNEINDLVKEIGVNQFKRKIIHLCKSLGEMSYLEAKEQFDREVLYKPDEYYNGIIQCRINRKHLFTKTS